MRWFHGLALLAVASCAWAQTFDLGGRSPFTTLRKRAVRAELFLSHESAKPGDTVLAAIKLTHSPGWHTYWQNPGDSGAATSIHWKLSNGVSPGAIQWPVPEKFTDPTVGLITYVFHNTAVLLVPLKIANDAPAGTNELAALVKWLECEKVCVPGSNMVQGTLFIGSESKASSETNLFAEAQRSIPSKQLPGSAAVRWDAPPSQPVRSLLIEWKTDANKPDFFPFTNALAVISNRTEVASIAPGNVLLRKRAKTKSGQWPGEITGLLVREENGTPAGYEVSLPVADTAKSSGSDSSAPAFKGESKPLLLWLLYAFIGGLILNIMPCVLPVIALKILGFVNQSREHPRHVRKLGVLYTLGVVTSFLVLAGIVIGLKAAGQKAGWGMQFGNPLFIVALTIIVTLVALNLFGVFEITLSGGAMGAASEAASRSGNAGAFMNGVLATVLATPCTAPFLAAALGFAFVQPSHMIVLFFLIIALGLAFPYLLLSWNPAWLKFLPKPGAWMERFKIAMGFPMLATAIWLFTLTDRFYGDRILWLGVFLVVLALAAWIYGEFIQRGRTRRAIAWAIVLFLLAGGFAYAIENKLKWRLPLSEETTASDSVKDAPKGIPWQRWSPENVAKAREEGRPVIVDFTAEWCITCNTVVKPALESAAVQAKLKEVNAVALLADYTTFPPNITAELEKYGRAGVPMVLVFPKDPVKPATVVPEAILPATQAGYILKALGEASK